MKTARGTPARPATSRRREREMARELEQLRARLELAEQTLSPIRNGEVDALVVAGKDGDEVFTREGADHSYRILIESMNEGALTLTADKVILYANQRFAHMVKCPLERVTGGSFRRFLSDADRAQFREVLKRTTKTGKKLQVLLLAEDGSQLPVQISIQRQAGDRTGRATVSMVVTDLTEARRNEELLRALTHRIVQVQEIERERVTRELHDNIAQLLCAVIFCSQALVESLSGHDAPARKAAKRLHSMIGETIGEVARISGDLRPNLLDELGLVAAIQSSSANFADRTGVEIRLAGMQLPAPLAADIELALYRIMQEALKNVEKHADARHVTIRLNQSNGSVLLTVRDDGAGFDIRHHEASRNRKFVLGMLGMRERATAVGGTLTVKSTPRAGTEVIARVPVRAR
jgi:two-component system NarL family sensor kinase